MSQWLPLRWNGAFWMSSSVDLWYLLISLNAILPGLNLRLTPVVDGADFLSIFWTCSLLFALGLSELFLATALLLGIWNIIKNIWALRLRLYILMHLFFLSM